MWRQTAMKYIMLWSVQVIQGMFFMFLKEVTYHNQGCICLIKNTETKYSTNLK